MNTDLFSLIDYLSDGRYRSCTDIEEKLGITRSTLCKWIAQLPSVDIVVQTIQEKGYQLPEPLSLLKCDAIKQYIASNHQHRIQSLNCHAILTSTHDSLDFTVLNQTQNLQFCLAEYQTSARGRLGRKWYSPFGQHIALSCAWLSNKDVSKLSGLSLVVGLACVNAFFDFGLEKRIQLKWPNDLIYDAYKVGGILIETNAEKSGFNRVTISIGINVNMSVNTINIEQKWTSLRQIDNQIHDRNRLAGILINQLITQLDQFTQHGFDPFIDVWKQHDYFYGQAVRLSNTNFEIIGTDVGVNEHGKLLLQHTDGSIHAYAIGDISLRSSSN